MTKGLASALAPQKHLIIVDDSCRFAHFVSRFFGNEIEFGSGEVRPTSKEAHEFWESSKKKTDRSPRPRVTPDGEVAVWWVPADRLWKKRLRAVLAEARVRFSTTVERTNGTQTYSFLLDVRGTEKFDLLEKTLIIASSDHV